MRGRAGNVERDQSDDAVAINDAGKGRYNQPLQLPQKKKDTTKETKYDPLALIGRFNCNAPGHIAKDLTSPKNIAKAVTVIWNIGTKIGLRTLHILY